LRGDIGAGATKDVGKKKTYKFHWEHRKGVRAIRLLANGGTVFERTRYRETTHYGVGEKKISKEERREYHKRPALGSTKQDNVGRKKRRTSKGRRKYLRKKKLALIIKRGK